MSFGFALRFVKRLCKSGMWLSSSLSINVHPAGISLGLCEVPCVRRDQSQIKLALVGITSCESVSHILHLSYLFERFHVSSIPMISESARTQDHVHKKDVKWLMACRIIWNWYLSVKRDDGGHVITDIFFEIHPKNGEIERVACFGFGLLCFVTL